MSWRYQQSTGDLSHNGVAMGQGYSGSGIGLNNPAEEGIVGIGPIPRGKWSIGTFFNHPKLGPCVAHLSAFNSDAPGRSGFFIHGDNAELDHTASHGCIILNPHLRHAIAESGDRVLLVT